MFFYLCILVFYLPANNQLFQGGELAIGFTVLTWCGSCCDVADVGATSPRSVGRRPVLPVSGVGRRLIGRGSVYTLGSAAPMLAGLLVTPFLTRAAGVEDTA